MMWSRLKTPPRPRGQRPEPESRGGPPPPVFPDTGFHMAFGIGAFPFGFFTTVMRGPDAPADAAAGPRPSGWQDSLFLFIAIFFLFWLLSV
ncbi:E3 ubiquitin-protein ligase RNF5-like [Alligator mississippiensis]|uniref:E3 ubiquitin-protein ligase RNF5-like n=1 Tax=Alligator mississippiensis TaxID=8496 RepID=A0A151PJ64_ALLMI|nr:E3 ubiquitin-protein ligase RNF5-like [Alligator mississippiensis]